MLTKFVANGTRFRRKTAPEMSFFPFRSAHTRSTEKPGVGLSEQAPLTRADSEVVLTCKAKELDERKGIGHILVDLAAAEHVHVSVVCGPSESPNCGIAYYPS